jgi:RNA polymerase sigma-70 factor (sigma-E family)
MTAITAKVRRTLTLPPLGCSRCDADNRCRESSRQGTKFDTQYIGNVRTFLLHVSVLGLWALERRGNHSGLPSRHTCVQHSSAVVTLAEPDAFRDFVAARSPSLVRTAWMLTGDMGSAEDLVQTALAKTWLRWSQVVRQDSPEIYVRRVMASTFMTWRRRRWSGEVPTASLPDSPTTADAYAVADLRRAVSMALEHLSRRQRAVLVLRFFDDLTEADTAAVLGCAVGTVKSQTARAFARLRSCPELEGVLVDMEVDRDER